MSLSLLVAAAKMDGDGPAQEKWCRHVSMVGGDEGGRQSQNNLQHADLQ